MRELFIDTNIIHDVLVGRGRNDEFSDYSWELFDYAATHSIRLNMCALSYANLYFLLRKIYSHEDTIIDLWTISQKTRCLPVSEEIIMKALTSDFRDFEDAIQNFCAAQIPNCEAIITRDKKGFRKSAIKIRSPKGFLERERIKK